MLAALIEWSIKNRIIVILATLLVFAAGTRALLDTPVDALPDLSDTQVIVYTLYSGQSPRVVEDQVTYPLTTALVSVPGSRIVRGYSFFGYSLVYVIFKDETDLYWARSRVLELLNAAQSRLPQGVSPTLGPDASGVGWVYEYALVSPTRPLDELRSLQDWYLKYGLSGVSGVAEVASIGGFVKQYQITLDPAKLAAFNLSTDAIAEAVRRSNGDAGGEVVEIAEAEFMVRGAGYLKGLSDLRKVPVPTPGGGVVRLADVADVATGPEMRRGAADLDGQGETVGGIVVMRSGENAASVIAAVKKKLEGLKAGLPADVSIVPVYDRSLLIERAVEHLRGKLIEEMLIVALVCLLFLMHARSALVAAFTLPAAILAAFIVMRAQGLNANIMSLSGIAIAIGAMVDAAVIMIENAHRQLAIEQQKVPGERRSHTQTIIDAATEVGPSLFWSLLVITVSFLPVFTLEAQEGRLFRPLAFTKTYAMAAAAICAVTIVPVLMVLFIRGRVQPEEKNPVNRLLIRIYDPVVRGVLRRPVIVILAALALLALTIYPISKLGGEFMPPLWEGDVLYMPTTFPGIGITKAKEILQQTDKLIATVPEVLRVFGKAGRAETATDPAGLDMLETTIMLKPADQWRKGMTREKLLAEFDRIVQFPGLANSWTMPIKTRIDMLSTGIKTPVGIKISGPGLDTLQTLAASVERAVRGIPGTASAFAEQTAGGNYLTITADRDRALAYGIAIDDINASIRTALGGMTVTSTVEGLARYSVSVRYARELRQSVADIGRIPITGAAGTVQLSQVADISLEKGPMAIKSENSRPGAWVLVDIRDRDIGSWIAEARRAVAAAVPLPAGYDIGWSGEYEFMQRAQARMLFVIPLTLLIIILIIFLNTKSLIKTAIVLLAVPFSLIGAFWTLHLLGYHLSIAVWVGLIALAGLDAETGVVMLLYLDAALKETRARDALTLASLKAAIHDGAVRRVRPKIMTATVIVAGLIPIMWSTGAGADVMQRIAAPMIGGVFSSVLLELLVYPAIYYLWKRRGISSQ